MIAGEGIADLATLELLPGERQVRMGFTGNEHLATGVARGAAVSGALVRVVTQGIVSGVKTAGAIQAGDRLAIATSGRVVTFNTITPAGVISGLITGNISGYVTGNVSGGVNVNAVSGSLGGLLSVQGSNTALGWASGLVSGITGALFVSGSLAGLFSSGAIAGAFNSGVFTGTAFNTERVLGKALTSGLSGASIQMLVSLG